jgi:hypothetical protein
MKPIAGLSHAELAGAMRRLDGKAKGGETALGSKSQRAARGKDFVFVSGEESGGGWLESGERAREERRAWKR